MAWEPKDKVNTGIALISLVISLYAFAIAERARIKNENAGSAHLYQYAYILGSRFELACEDQAELNLHPSMEEKRRSQIQKHSAFLQSLIQSSIDERKWSINLNNYAFDGRYGQLYGVLREHLQEQYGLKASDAFRLGVNMQQFTSAMIILTPDTETQEKCDSAQTRTKGDSQVSCQSLFLWNFPNMITPINEDLKELGIKPIFDYHPSSWDDALTTVARTTKALNEGWAQ